jgi:hypothetical protein
MSTAFSFSTEDRKLILEALYKKAGKERIVCPVCGKWKWTMPDGFVSLKLLQNWYWNIPSNSSLPCVALVCDTCGNTLLFNVASLGLTKFTGEGDMFD